ncbi:MAG: HlyD family efflux transporter periplasmic adaptor subunit [Pirellulales bacterium]|nr:HlyD family efflux transporter periplasmic adaptor subunit [Pirellulales bacterium]
MIPISPHNLSAADRQVALRARGDLQIVPVVYAGQAAYVVKDPLTLELFHLTAAEYFFLHALEQPTSLRSLRSEFQRQFAPRRITDAAVQHGINQLYHQGLLLSIASGQGQQLSERGQRNRRQNRWQAMLNLLSFRLGSIDATRVIDGLHARVHRIFSWPVLALMLGVVLYAVWILLSEGHSVLERLPSLQALTQPRYWFLWLATIALVKVIHELAHAVTCQHLGGRCHEIGMLLLACLPCLYCDVSDVWRLPNKWQRIAVSAAGMIAEFCLAAIALIAWWHTEPGLLHTWCLSVVIVCTVGTVLVNANPLLRYDGYYILADLVEIPNLAARAQGLLPAALRAWLLGDPREKDPLLTRRERHGMLAYALSARVYLLFVLLGIFVVLLTWARPYRAESLVYTLGALTLAGLIFRPLRSIWSLGRNPSVRARLRAGRATLLAISMVAAMGLILVWPIEQTVIGPAVFVPTGAQTVYATSPGELVHAIVPGSVVQQGDILARLSDPKTDLALARQTGEYEVCRVRHDQLGLMGSRSRQASQQLPTARAALTAAASQLEELHRKAAELTLRAPRAGTVFAPPEVVDDRMSQDVLPRWTGVALDKRNQGSWIKPGTVLCTIGDPNHLDALLSIRQVDIAEVQPGQAVRILLGTAPVRVLAGTVEEVARRASHLDQADGVLAADKFHLVQVRLSVPDPGVLVGNRGTAKIKAARRSLGEILSRTLQQMLRLPW